MAFLKSSHILCYCLQQSVTTVNNKTFKGKFRGLATIAITRMEEFLVQYNSYIVNIPDVTAGDEIGAVTVVVVFNITEVVVLNTTKNKTSG